jgi:uncharacterized protein YwqG/predicted DNA-binding protein (MmcQ/YjbR family)
MPSLSQSDIDQVLVHCRSKVGTEEHSVHRDGVQFRVLSGSLDSFATLYLKHDVQYVLLRCDNTRREQMERSGASVRVSDRRKWSGPNWKWTEVELESSMPLQTLIALIDESYDFTLVKLKDSQKSMLSLLASKLPVRQLLAEMIDSYGLQERKADIEKLLLPALRLKTSPADESQLPLGSSKIGGHPDLPESLFWPTLDGDRPLSFLAQINLDQVLPEQRLVDLPAHGILYVFSVYGWQAEGTADPDVPGSQPQPGWTQILFHDDPAAPLQRRDTPERAAEYPAAQATFHSTLCLPISVAEPSVVALRLDQAQADRFDEMNLAFTYVANYSEGPHARHLLLGYADWAQYVIDRVKEQDLRLLFQLASDPNTSMCWGDGGYIYSFIGKPDLAALRFSNITTEYQCG